MIQLQNILVPVDDSLPAKTALRYGVSLAIQFRARLVVAHIVPTLAIFDFGKPAETTNIEKLAFAEAKKSLSEIIPPEYRALVNFHPIVKSGDVREELLGIVADEKIDLVVMGSHGRRIIERFLLGSTTEHMLRRVPVPVLTVSHISPKHEIHTPAAIPIRKIVYATDLSNSTKVGLRYAADLARMVKAELRILHVVDPMETGQWGVEVPGTLPFDFSAIQIQAETRLRQLVAETESADIKPEITVIAGIPHSTISRFADESNADILVLNLQNKGVLERVMLGATAERVIRAAHIPVLSIPAGTASFRKTTSVEKAGTLS